MQAKIDRPDSERLVHAQALADALSLDMETWFTPTAGNFFGRLSKDPSSRPCAKRATARSRLPG